MSTKKKEWRGGARKNAGRPKLSRVEKLVNVGLSLNRGTLKAIDKFAEAAAIQKKKKRQEAIRILINAGLEKSGFEIS